MPKQTFLNLSEQKRDSIEQAALDEFSQHGFDASNMNRIVAQSNIAKGSFYQYFDDKWDLYLYLIDMLYRKKMKCIEPVLRDYKKHSFIHNLSELFRLGFSFAQSDPKLHLLHQDYLNKQRSVSEAFRKKHQPEANDIYVRLLSHAKMRGEVRDELNIELSSFFISTLISETIVLLMRKTQTKEQNGLTVQEMLSFIEHALSK